MARLIARSDSIARSVAKMNSRYWFPVLFVLAIAIGTSSHISAQQAPFDEWKRLSLLPANTRLYVESDGRKPTKGRLLRVTDSGLTLRAGGRDVELPQVSVSAVYYGRRSSKLKRGLIGALAGAGAGVLIGGLAAAGGADPLVAAGGFIYGIPAGAAVGALTGGGMKKGDLIYIR